MGAIFISHTSNDKTFVRRLAMDLAQRDFEIWYDEWELEVGARLSDSIEAGVDEAPFVIVVLSEAVQGSEWVEREIERALAVEKQQHSEIILPIKIDDCDVPTQLADRLYADFSSGSYLERLEKLCRPIWAKDRPGSRRTRN